MAAGCEGAGPPTTSSPHEQVIVYRQNAPADRTASQLLTECAATESDLTGRIYLSQGAIDPSSIPVLAAPVTHVEPSAQG